MVSRCPECPGEKNCVGSDGPASCDLMGIGEAPGSNEDRLKLPFQGKAGEELNRGYLPIIGVPRSRIRIANAIRCLPMSFQGKLDPKRDKDIRLLESCSNHNLYPEIRQVKPKVIIPMGAFACRAIDPEINLELHHGVPLDTKWGTTFPMYHPAGGIHEPKKMLLIRTDWVRMDKFLKHKLNLPVDEFAGQEDYQEIESPGQLKSVLLGLEDENLSMDTETMRGGKPFCVTISVEPGTGYLLRCSRIDLMYALQYWFDRWRGLFIFHNWLFDGAVFERIGLKLPYHRVRDTMMIAFQLGNIPQGLKTLSYRELGAVMQDFDDLVTPHSIPKVIDYYRDAYTEEWPTPEEELVRNAEGKLKLYKPQGFTTKLKRFFTDLSKNPEKDVFKMWEDNWEGMHARVEERMGKWPGKCISHAAEKDWPAVVRYAARDADMTGRLYPILCKMRRLVRKRSQEYWSRSIAA